ncbi:MAG TPA: pyruvoyl-dependent arginine decarboxylase [Candidatus Saccharimonadales bacterium]|nr:pyruvoyl-dependent arginine decarboxylase [Candidatus Saccharimonadales bacterium]
MKIEVVAGTGVGPTKLAAFDAAEMKIGVADCNLVRLSSVIPPGSDVVSLDGPTTKNPQWGDRLTCIYADMRTSVQGKEAWAGIGWVMLDDGKGLFCEHEEESREAVENSIHDSLINFTKIRGIEPDESRIQKRVVGIKCEDKPVCALAMAVYQANGWDD